jgi:hypothetical protein
MKNIFTIGILILVVSCKCANKATNENAKQETNLKNYTVVTVIDYSELSGCGFIFSLNNGAKLIPGNMPDSLRKHDLKLRIIYKQTNLANTCMAGKTISLIDVKPFE